MGNITVKSDGSGITVAAQGPQGIAGPTGGIRDITEVTSTYSTNANDAAVIATGTFTITLHTLASASQEIVIKTVSGSITVDGNGSETIEGISTLLITTGQSFTLIPTSIGWVIT